MSDVILQVWVSGSDITPRAPYTSEELAEIHAKLMELCAQVEPYGFVRAEMYVDGKTYHGQHT